MTSPQDEGLDPAEDTRTRAEEAGVLGQRLLWVTQIRKVRGRFGPAPTFAITIVAALIAAIPIIYLVGSDPVTTYRTLLQGSLGSQRGVAETLISATPLVLTGLSVAVAFQTGLFNIGAEGQLVVGGLAAGALAAELQLPVGAHLAAAIAAGIAAGALWAYLPGLLKAYKGVHEVVTTIMLNFVAFSVSRYLVSPGGALVSATQPSATERVQPSAQLTRIWDPTRLHTGIFIAALTVVFVWYFLYRTPSGYGFRFVGANPVAARYAGISPKSATINAMLMSGGLAGLAGAIEVLGVHGRYFDGFSPGFGFDAIAVALLGMLNPMGVAVAALFFGVLRAGSSALQAQAGITRDMITVIAGLVVAFVAGRVALQTMFSRRRMKHEAGGGKPQVEDLSLAGHVTGEAGGQ